MKLKHKGTDYVKFKDVVHLYVGCTATIKGVDGVTKITGVHANGNIQVSTRSATVTADKLLPVLRPLSLISEADLKEVFRICYRHVFDHDGHDLEFQTVPMSDGGGIKATETVLDKLWQYGLTVDGETFFTANGNRLNVPERKVTAFLLRKHYDLFDLIDTGQAQAISEQWAAINDES